MSKIKHIPPSHIILSGGGMKCLSYVGAFQELEERGMLKNVKQFSCVSAGGLMAFIYTIGYTLEEIFNITKLLDFSTVQNIDEDILLNGFLNFGIDNGKNLEKFIESLLKHKGYNRELTFQQLYNIKKVILKFYAVDLNEGLLKEFSVNTTPNISILFALRASMSIPGYFTPLQDPETNHYYVDGALLNNYPITLVDDKNVLGLAFDYTARPIEKIECIQSYFYQLIVCLYDKLEQIPLQYKEKTIYIKCDISIINFFLSREERIEIMLSGRKAVIQYLECSGTKIVRRNSII
jgi:predicted acylesterase/phospholipase RssA